ncbi:hypothetical protein ATO10_11157 [Actibacterium atlanticum]|uniref:DUF2842 domain-containing protein n=1 Tax=Actibacterium atlanticum TaxID=1461693 RepID=A0A058ZKX6_9RHOB|nr:DUF2842 domain-containing protein [Actibacterium atlanticum]KCV81466.1 hypothetical protein ATO10_11157 [Actibacterium atlanticum]
MALSYKARRRWSLVILLLGLPAYIAAVWWVLSLFDERPGLLIELAVYIVLGILWALPFKFVFKGVGQADPDVAQGADTETKKAEDQ